MQTSPIQTGSASTDAHGPAPLGIDAHDAPHEELTHVEGDNINAGLLSVIFALVAVSVLLVVVLLQAWFYNLTSSIALTYTAPIEDPQSLLGRALMEQQAKFKDYQWVNKEAQVRAIPIDRAMVLVANEMSAASSAADTGQAGKEKTKP